MRDDETAIEDTSGRAPEGSSRAVSDRPSRRHLLRGASWAAPALAVSVAAPAVAASPHDVAYGINFDGGGGANGWFNSMYLNLGTVTGTSPVTLTSPLTVTIDVIGLNSAAREERSMTFGSSHGAVTKQPYNPDTRTTTVTWTIPAGARVPVNGTDPANPDLLFTFRDGASKDGRITNKVVIRSITGGRLTEVLHKDGSMIGSVPANLPIDSSVVKDYDRRAVSPDGIY